MKMVRKIIGTTVNSINKLVSFSISIEIWQFIYYMYLLIFFCADGKNCSCPKCGILFYHTKIRTCKYYGPITNIGYTYLKVLLPYLAYFSKCFGIYAIVSTNLGVCNARQVIMHLARGLVMLYGRLFETLISRKCYMLEILSTS